MEYLRSFLRMVMGSVCCFEGNVLGLRRLVFRGVLS